MVRSKDGGSFSNPSLESGFLAADSEEDVTKRTEVEFESLGPLRLLAPKEKRTH
jgi:hypothetical protein